MWWVQPFRKNCMLSFKTAKMTCNSRKSTFLCVFITTHHSFCLPNVFWRGGGSPDPKDPPPGSALVYSCVIISRFTEPNLPYIIILELSCQSRRENLQISAALIHQPFRHHAPCCYHVNQAQRTASREIIANKL